MDDGMTTRFTDETQNTLTQTTMYLDFSFDYFLSSICSNKSIRQLEVERLSEHHISSFLVCRGRCLIAYRTTASHLVDHFKWRAGLQP